MKFTSVIRWMLLIGLGVTVVAGGAGFHYWNQRHELVETQLRLRFDEVAPELRLVLGQTHLDGLHRLTLSDVELRDRKTDQPLFRARNVTVHFDSQMLMDHQQVVVRSVLVDGAEALVVRQEDGRWNWQNYNFNPPSSSVKSLPQVDIRQLRLQLHLKHGDDIPSARLVLTSPLIQAVPASAHQLDLQGEVELAGAGTLDLSGSCDLATGEWSLGGQLEDLVADQKLLELAQSTSPQMRTQLQQLDRTLQGVLPARQTVSSNPDSALLIGHDISTAPRFQGRLDLQFDIGQKPGQQIPVFRLFVDIKDGQLSVPGLPVRLTDVKAVFFANNEQVELRVHQAQYEDSQLSGQFKMRTQPGAAAPAGSFKLVNFPVGARLRPMCPPSVQRLFDHFDPDLRVSAEGQVVRRHDGKWILGNVEADVFEGRLKHHRFQYQLTDIRAKLRQRPLQETVGEVVIDVWAQGRVSKTTWKAVGFWKNLGPEVESHFDLDVADFPLDGRFREGLEPAPKRVVESLNLAGLATGRLSLHRPPGVHRKTDVTIDAEVTNASLQFRGFPFLIEQLSGHVFFNAVNSGPQKTARWEFSKLHGRHGDTEIFGDGHFDGLPRPGVLDLTVQARRLALDSDLYSALADSQQNLWRLLEPSGLCDVTAKIDWTAVPDQTAVVNFPADTPVRIYDARIRPKPFPYAMDVEEAIISFDPNDPEHSGVQYCKIHSFKASHKDAPIVATGWAQHHSDGQWQVHFGHLTAKQLPPDDDLRAALPNEWREILTRLHRRGRVSVNDSELDFRGGSDGHTDVTAAWNMDLHLHNCTLSAGLDLEKVTGRVTAVGSWDGEHLNNQGEIELDSTRVLDMPLTKIRGPYTIEDAKLVLGAQEVLKSGKSTKVEPGSRMTAQAYGGTLFVDAVVDSRPGRGYLLFTELKDGLLQSFARDKIDGSGQLRGNVDAWLALSGEGDLPGDAKGSGQLEISPAALYELPVVLEVLSAFTSLTPSKKTAFDYAILSFDVLNERFDFNQVDLVGESMALRGRGSVGFGGDVVLDFYSRPTKSRRSLQLGNLIGNLLVNGATQWTKVEVRGTTERPQARLLPTAQLDDSLRQFLGAFNPAPGTVPRLSVPGVFPFAGNPMTFGPLPFRR